MRLFGFLCLSLGLNLVLGGCKRDQHSGHTHGSATSNPAKPRTAATPASKDAIIEGYEVVRKALAADDLAATKKGSLALASLAKASGGSAAEADKGRLAGMAAEAAKLAEAGDFDKARLVFGDLSKHVLGYASEDKRKAGITAYSCPMAKGYKKWLQADADMANPYMGKAMLKCGGKTNLVP